MRRTLNEPKNTQSTQESTSQIARKIFFLAVVVAFVLGVTPAIYGQSAGSFSGNVRDKSGSGIAGATVTVTAQETGLERTAKSDEAEKAKKNEASAEERVSLPRECVECHALIPPKTRACPNCGAVPKRRDTVQVREGELVELGQAGQGASVAAKKGSAKELIAAQGRQAVLSQLIAMQGKKKDGWVFFKFKALFGSEPAPDLRRTPAPPTPELQLWVHSENIRWARGAKARASFAVAAE